jgi:hypothetical protein
MKLNKHPLAKYDGSWVKLIERCKSAAGTMEKLKSEKIEDQKIITEFRQGQFISVRESVKS